MRLFNKNHDEQDDTVRTIDDVAKIEGRYKETTITLGIILVFLVLIVYFACIFVGTVDLTPKVVINVWRGHESWGNTYIVEYLRMPRIACAAIVGAGLSIAGMAMQALFKNPLASPSVLGISSGASFGAALALVYGTGFGLGMYNVSLMAFIFCFITIFLVYMIASTRHGTPTVLLLLAGVAVGAFFSGLTSAVQYLTESDALKDVVYWMMGSFSRCGWTEVKIGAITVGLGIAIITLCAKELNLISLGENQARSLGVNIVRVRYMILIGTALTVGGSVAISGTIGFVGLIIPHIFRALCGPNHRYLVPICILGGAIFLMLMDAICRTYAEMPIGVITSLIGAPFFVYILRKKKKDFWRYYAYRSQRCII